MPRSKTFSARPRSAMRVPAQTQASPVLRSASMTPLSPSSSATMPSLLQIGLKEWPAPVTRSGLPSLPASQTSAATASSSAAVATRPGLQRTPPDQLRHSTATPAPLERPCLAAAYFISLLRRGHDRIPQDLDNTVEGLDRRHQRRGNADRVAVHLEQVG